MAGFSDAIETAVLDTVFRKVAWVAPTSYVLSLHTGDPGDTASPASEVAGGSYARQAVTFNAAANGSIAIAAAVSFADMPACTVTHAGLHEVGGSARYLASAAISPSKTLNAGDTFTLSSCSFGLD